MVFAGFMSQNNLIGGGGSPPIDNYTFNNPSYSTGDYIDLNALGFLADSATGLCVRDSGLGVYIAHDLGGTPRLSLLTMTTPYNITSVTAESRSGVNMTGVNPSGMRVDPNGIDYFYNHNAGSGQDRIYYETMNSAHNPSLGTSGSIANQGLSGFATNNGEAFTYAGTQFYTVSNLTEINHFDNPGAIVPNFVGFSTLSNTTGFFPAGANIRGMDMKDDGSKFYFLDRGNEAIYECDAGTNFDTSTLTIVNTIDISSSGIIAADHPGGSPIWSGLGIVRDTGTDIYFSDFTNTRIYRINLA